MSHEFLFSCISATFGWPIRNLQTRKSDHHEEKEMSLTLEFEKLSAIKHVTLNIEGRWSFLWS